MKEGLRRLRGTAIATDLGEISLCDTYREGKDLSMQMTANLINFTTQPNTIRSQLKCTLLKNKSQVIDFDTSSTSVPITDKYISEETTNNLLKPWLSSSLKSKRFLLVLWSCGYVKERPSNKLLTLSFMANGSLWQNAVWSSFKI